MSNPRWTRSANVVIGLLRHSGDWSGGTSDPHPPVGKAQGSSDLARVEVQIPESDWPSQGRLVRALLTMHQAGTSAHGSYQGDNPRAVVYRLNEKPDRHDPTSFAGDPVEFGVHGAETHDVTAMVEEMLPGRIKRRDGSSCGNKLFGRFQFRSSNEDDSARSFVMSDTITLSVEIKTAVTPDAPGIIEVTGAQDGTSGPTIVGSTDGRTLEVIFAFRGAAGDTCAKAELAFYGVGATDDSPGTVVKTTGNIAPSAGGGAGLYRTRLTGLALGAEGRFRIRTTSQRGEQGDWSSLDDDDSHVQLAVIPGPPLDIVFQPYTDDPHILFSLNSPAATDYLTGGEVEATLLPQGTLGWASGMQDIGGATRRADLTWNGTALGPGQRISYRVRTRNQDDVVGQWSAPQTVTVYELQAVTFSPAPGRLTSREPTITLTFPLADGARLRLLDPDDDTKVVYDSGATPLTDQTSHAFVIPADTLAWGQSFRAVGSYVPDGGGTTYTDESQPVAYTIANLATAALSVPDAVARKVGTTDPEWLRTVTDPDGAATAEIEQEILASGTPQGSGVSIVDDVDATATALYAVPGGTFSYETSVDARVRAKNDTDEFGPWSPWLTITALRPPDVDLVLPSDSAILADPTDTLDWSVTAYGIRSQASALVAIYSDGVVLASLAIEGDTSEADIPAFLLDDATSYLWDVTVTDTGGMVTTSAQRTFTTAFAEPLGVNVVTAEPDPESGAVVVSWDDGGEPYLDHYEVSWLDDSGDPVRIDGGPESLLDGNEPFMGTTLTHIGARLGVNTYVVSVSNGWRSSDPVSTSGTLTVDDPAFPWLMVDGTGQVAGLPVIGADKTTESIAERYRPPGGQPRQLTWGAGANDGWTLQMERIPASDPLIGPVLRAWMQAGTGAWFKGPPGAAEDPMWVAIQRVAPSPGPDGLMGTGMDLLELGDPVHAILPPPPAPIPEDEGDIYVLVDEDDFGVIILEAP